MGKKTFSSFKPKNFQPSATDRLYVEFKELGSKISSLKSKLIFLGDDKKLLVKSIDTDDGNIVTGEVQLTPYFKIEYPVSWENGRPYPKPLIPLLQCQTYSNNPAG